MKLILAGWTTIILLAPNSCLPYIDTSLGGAPTTLQSSSPSALAEFFDKRYVLDSRNPRHAHKRPIFVNDPAAPESARKVMLLHLQSSDPPSIAGQRAIRTELSVKKEYARPGEERWYAMSFYLDHFWPTYDKKTKFVLLQLHSSQKTVVLQPNVEVWSIGDQLTLSLRNNTRPVPPSLGEIGTYDDYYTSKTNTTQLFVNLGKLQKQKWYCFVINAKWSHTPNEGHTKIWMNGVMVHEQFNNPNAYENLDPTLGIYPKIGIYAPAGFSTDVWGNSDPWVKSYVDFVTLADPRGMSAREMYSRTPCGEIKVFPAYPKTG